MTISFVKQIYLIGLFSLLVTACSPQQASTPPTIAPSPAVILKLTQPPTLTSTVTTIHPPRPTSTPKPTALPTTIPFPTQDSLGLQLSEGKLRIDDSASIVGKDGLVYSAYILVDPTFEAFRYGDPEHTADSCHLTFFRWDGKTNQLQLDVSQPDQLQPVMCRLVNWNDEIDTNTQTTDYRVLGLQGYKSDINQNGLPELTVYEWWCPNACDDTSGYIYSVYEIGDGGRINKVSESLSGTIRPWPRIVHSQDPLTIYVFDPIEYENRAYIEMDRLYTWNGFQFIDVTANYADEYKVMADEIVKSLESRYGQSLDYYLLDFPKILALYNLAELPREEGLASFLEVTDLSHWPDSKSEVACWLQISRAYVQQEFNRSGELVLPPSPFYLLGPGLESILHELRINDYDVTECK